MPIIAMTQEMGSLAKEVALRLSEELKLEVMRHEVVDHVAQKLHVSKSLIGRLREGKAGMLEKFNADRRSMALYTAEELFELADHGNVVLRGWGATCLLRPVSHVVCVRVTRSMPRRIEWLMAHLETDDAAFAEAEIRRSDAAHAARMHAQFGVTWGDPVLYDLVLNTDRLSVDSCVGQIAALVQRPEFAETEASKARLTDMKLEAGVRVALREQPETEDVQISIAAEGGRVTLSGIVMNNEEREACVQAATGVPGVREVVDALRLMQNSRLFASAKYT